jgi:hypothetical protein
MTQVWLRRREAAAYLGVSIRYLEARATDGNGPPFSKVGTRMTLYRVEDLDAWTLAHVRRSTAQAA